MIKTSEQLLQHYKGFEGLIRKLQQITDKYEKKGEVTALGFCNSGEIKTIRSVLSDRIPYDFFGGYQQAQRQMCLIGENFDFKDYICCLSASYNRKFNSLSHRDIKGAIYNSGIELNRFGDMWVDDDRIYFYCCKDISQFLQNNLNKVGNCTVRFQEVEFQSQTYSFEEYRFSLSSLRLDKVVSALIRKSRQKAQDFIYAGFVNVNYLTIEDFTYLCNNNDILSLKTHGRYQIIDIEKNRKSGKIIIKVKKFV